MATQFVAPSSSSSSSSSIHSWTYHVFLSFRGEDTRNSFTGHLHSNLVQKGIKTFIDDGLTRGEEISSTLFKAIEESKISVIVFSENYASSKWCLEELGKIMQCNESKQQIVYPVFYKVDPSHVRNQTGSFGQALAHHDNLEKVARWKTALTKAGNLSGWHFLHGGHESEFIRKIVEEISQQVSNLTYLHREKYLVGIESRLENMEKLLCVGESDVRMVGVWGIGGLGKTTITKAVYNSTAHKFEGSCFLENVREKSLKYGGLEKLQKFLLSKTLGLKELEINSVDEGSSMIKERLNHKRVLLILDDVNDLDQLTGLVGKPNWFGSGSRIIITTRDQDLLRRHDVNQIYQVEKLNHLEALELFNNNAFKEKVHMSDYTEQIDSIIRYSEGLPLVLEVLGSYLHGRSTYMWKDALECYKRDPKRQQFLKLSYDALEPMMKEVFLHVACFFKGENKNFVMNILEGCDLPKLCIEVLIEKSLISITETNDIWMHDLLEEMGKEIVCQESLEPGERSRLWLYEDVYQVFAQNTGTNKVKGIMVKGRIPDQQIPLNRKSFLTLKNLQILIISDNIISGDHVDYLPRDLSLFDWKFCPVKYFPADSYPRKLVALKMDCINQISLRRRLLKGGALSRMPWICMSPLGKSAQNMPSLKSLHLGKGCDTVTTFSDLSIFPNLEELHIEFNTSFKVEIVENMISLKRVVLNHTAIRELPYSSIGHLINLEELSLLCCQKLEYVPCNIFELQHLKLLEISHCYKLVAISTEPEFSTELTSLQERHYAPLSIRLNDCYDLVEIGEFPREIYRLDVSFCSRLKRISKLSNILEGKDLRMIPRMNLCGCNALSLNLLALCFSCRQSEYQVILPHFNIPRWFTCYMDVEKKDELQVCNFKLDFPGHFKWEDKGLAFCACFRLLRIYINGVFIIDASGRQEDVAFRPEDFVWLYYMPFDAIIQRLSQSGLPPPSTCLVRFEVQLSCSHISDFVKFFGTLGLHVVMPKDEDPYSRDVILQSQITL